MNFSIFCIQTTGKRVSICNIFEFINLVMDTFSLAANAIASLVFLEAIKEIGKNIGRAVSDFVGFTVSFITEKVRQGTQAIFHWN